MSRQLRTTKSFRSDYKKLSNDEVSETDVVVKKLMNDEPLDAKYRDHDLSGKYKGTRECHVESEMLITKLSSIHIRQIMDSIRRLSPDKQRRL